MKLANKIIVVTGAGGGIGRQLTLGLIARGARVAAVDLRQEGLRETAALAGAGDRLSRHEVDISDRASVEALPAAVEAAHGAVDGVINNAGVIQPFVPFNDLDYAVIDRMISVNLYGPIHMIKAFLPRLLARPEAHIANVSSMGGFFPFPGQTMYGAAKAGVKLLTEGLYAELLRTNVAVSVVLPGAIATDIAKNSGVRMGPTSDDASAAAMRPEEAAQVILDGVEADKLHIFVGRDSKLMNVVSKVMPELATRLVERQMRGLIAVPKSDADER